MYNYFGIVCDCCGEILNSVDYIVDRTEESIVHFCNEECKKKVGLGPQENMEEEKELDITPLLNDGWKLFKDEKPPVDALILVTRGAYVEVSYYNPEPEEHSSRILHKAWRFDEHDESVFNGTEEDILWKRIFPENYQ
jgi:hypothetical protein